MTQLKPDDFESPKDCIEKLEADIAQERKQNWNPQPQDWIEKQEADIDFCLYEFKSQKGAYTETTTIEEMNADLAEHDIRRAKKKIRELMDEIERQEASIRNARRIISRFKTTDGQKRLPGRPKADPASQWRQVTARRFVAQWVESLKAALSIKSSGELAQLAGGNKMTWWRWGNQEAVPTPRLLEALLNVKIKSGELKGIALCDIQTSPSLTRLIDLVELV